MIISYASVESISNNNVVCEVEQIPIHESSTKDFSKKPCYHTNLNLSDFIFTVKEGDIVLVQHDNSTVSKVVGKDDFERARRTSLLKKIMNA